MTKLGIQGGADEEKQQDVKQEVAKDPKVFTVVQPTFVPIPIQTTEPMRKSVPSTWCLMARLLALVLIGSLLFSLLVFAVWNKDEVARAIAGGKSAHEINEPQFAALNSQAQQQAELKKAEEAKEDAAHITIKQTDEGTQMIVQLPKASEETKDGAKTEEGAAVIPMIQLIPARSSSSSSSSSSEDQQDDSQEMDRRPMHPYEMEAPSPDAFNYRMHPLMAFQAARAAQYENEMRAWRMRRLQQMLVLAAVQQAQQREAAMRYAFFQRQQWAAQQMAMQQEFEARRAMEWQEYWRRAAFARAMQQQQMQQQMMQQQPVASSWQAAEQPRPFWTQQQQPQMAWPQQQFVQPQQQQPIMPFHPLWMQQQQMQQQQQPQPAFENQGPQVPQSQPLLVFQQALQQRLAQRMQQLQQQQEMQQPQQQQSEEEEPQQQQPQPQPHAFIFIRRFFPIPQDSRESRPAVSSEESNEKNIPLRPHDASAQQIVEQMRGGQPQQQAAALPDAPIPGIHDRIFQHFQSLSQQMQDRSGHAQSQPPLFASVPNSIEASRDSESRSYDQDAIYEKLQRKAMEMQQDSSSSSVQSESKSSDSKSSDSDSNSKEDSADDHDIRRGNAVLGADDKSAKVSSDLSKMSTTTEPVMIENFVRAQSQEKDDDDDKDEEDELTPEEKRKIAQLDSTELKEAAALEASLEREANDAKNKQVESDRAQIAKVEEDIVRDANKDSSSSSSSSSSEQKDDEPSTTTVDPLSEFFRFFEKEAVKLSAEREKAGERVVVDSETGTHQPTPVTEDSDEDENSSETVEVKEDETPQPLPSEAPTKESKDSEEVSASIDAVPVSNEADIKVSQVANSREIPTLSLASAA